ncbi:hypothetical protein BDV3_000769 [Batrachochytrium dendrobatidis]
MNFLSHLDSSQIFSTEDAYKPFLFELISQDKMRELLQPAFKYILTVAAQSYPRWLLLAYRHDKLIYALIMAIIDYHRLCRWGGSFTETFYGLCRSGVKDSSSTTTSLSPSQIRKSLAALILVPLVKSKLDEIHERLAQRRTSERFVGFVPESDSETQSPSTNLFNSSSNLEKLGKIAVKVFKTGYPYTNAAYSAIILGFQIAYMYGKTPYYSPWLYLCGLKLKRLSVSDYQEYDRKARQTRGQALDVISNSRGMQFVARVLQFVAGELVGVIQYAIPMGILLFKFLEWWYASDHHKSANMLPIPPPPDPIPPHIDGTKLPKDAHICPLCSKPRTNSAMLSTGYAFCYPCIFNYVSEYGKCPITFIPLRIDNLRKIYHT